MLPPPPPIRLPGPLASVAKSGTAQIQVIGNCPAMPGQDRAVNMLINAFDLRRIGIILCSIRLLCLG